MHAASLREDGIALCAPANIVVPTRGSSSTPHEAVAEEGRHRSHGEAIIERMALMASLFHVAMTGSDSSDGSQDQPLRTINRAADLAQAGDTVVVHEGEYREWVRPRRGGLSDQRRITYEAAAGEHVVIKGSEPVTGWEPVERDGVEGRRCRTRCSARSTRSPRRSTGTGSSTRRRTRRRSTSATSTSTGTSFYEVLSLQEVSDPPLRTEVLDDWTGLPDRVRNPEQTRYVWYAEVGDDATTIWANFQGADPNAELVEINVRRSVFYPTEHHLDYITVRGFELAQAACPWTPPTADQPGLIGPNWAKGWIIEDNVIHDAKCSAISIGKEASTGHNYATARGDKPGYQYQLESVFSARQIGWDKEHIGSHVIRRNTIYDCGQNGIVGHLGCVFSTIEDNHIYNIALKREFYGYEIGGIKLHAAIDVVIHHNRIHDCSLGTWLDWQTQGTRITRNVYYAQQPGPLRRGQPRPLSRRPQRLRVDGVLRVVQPGRRVRQQPVLRHPRLAAGDGPRHAVPRSAQHPGRRLRGDLRRRRPVRRQRLPRRGHRPRLRARVEAPRHGAGYGTALYEGHPTTFDEYLARIDEQPGGDLDRYPGVKQPVYLRNNVYAGGARASDADQDAAGARR